MTSVRVVRGAFLMSKLQLFGIGVLACGAISGFATGGAFGLVVASVCLIVGLVMVVASEARGTKPASGHLASAKPSSRMIVAIKDVHARPHQGGRFRAVHDPDQPDLELEVFLKCWLVNESDVPLTIQSLQLELDASNGSKSTAERISDFQNWQIGALQEEWDEWDMRLRVAMDKVTELDTTSPLECGLAREGWLHFRVRNVTPSDFKSAPMRISLNDSLGQVHLAAVNGIRHLPGRIWPVLASGAAAANAPTEFAAG